MTKSRKDADKILNNKLFGGDWIVVSETKEKTPPEAVKVSIETPVEKTTKGKK